MFKETGHHHLILVRCYFAGKGEWLMKKFNLIISLWLAGVIIFCSASAAPGQVQGKIKGKVIDAQGNPLEKAEVTIVSVVTASKKYETTTGKDGRFSGRPAARLLSGDCKKGGLCTSDSGISCGHCF